MEGSGKQVDWARRIVEFSANLLALVRGGDIVYLNAGGRRMLGLADDDGVGRAFASFVHADYRELVAEGLEVLAAEGMPLPLKILRADGGALDAELSVTVADDALDADFIVEARDITKFIRAAEETRRREETLKGTLAALADGVITIDETGTVKSINRAAEEMFGVLARQVVGGPVSRFMPEPYAGKHDAYLHHYLTTGEARLIGQTREMEGLRADGTTFPIDLSVTELKRGHERLFIGVVRDISDRLAAERQIRHMAHHDSLTGLPNRNLFSDRLAVAAERAQRAREKMALMYVDLDKFKPINDTLGHEAGDIVLKTVARRLEDTLRKSDTVARVGGDEFVIIIEANHGRIDPEAVAHKILDAVPQPIEVGGTDCSVGCSIGVAIFPDDAFDLTELGRCADEAMYAVKQHGRNNVAFYHDTIESD